MTGDAQTATGVTTYTYDLANKLTGIDAAGTANDAVFTFDAFGRFRTRVLATASGTDTYSYAGTGETVVRIANTISGTTVDTDSIVSPAGDRLGVKAGGIVNWLLPDLHGDIAGSLTQDETTLANAIRYDPYGETLATGSAGGTAVGEDAWTYQGRLDIAPEGLDTPLYDMSARFYAPGIGAFTQLDTYAGTAQHPLSMNRFLYAAANPATLTDPTGHAGCKSNGAKCVAGDKVIVVKKDGSVQQVGSTSGGGGGTDYDEVFGTPAADATGPATASLSALNAMTTNQLRFYIDGWRKSRGRDPSFGDTDYLYAVCLYGGLDAATCASYALPKNWGDLDGPLGTLVVAPLTAVAVGSTAAVAKPFADWIASHPQVAQAATKAEDYLVSPHAYLRMGERGVTPEAIIKAIETGTKFVYYHARQFKVGFWDPETGVMVGTVGDVITTLMVDVKPQYIENLKALPWP